MLEYNLDETLRVARQRLAARPAEVIAQASGAVPEDGGQWLAVLFLGRTLRLSYPEGRPAQPIADPREEILALHYLSRAQGTPLVGRYIAFRELPGGAIYTGPFQRRAVQPLVSAFGSQPEALLQAAGRLGGVPQEGNGTAALMPALPRVPVLLLVRPGDEEFPPSGNVLFDASAPDYLETEDYAHLAQMVVEKLRRVGG